jgi:hypothetical protein
LRAACASDEDSTAVARLTMDSSPITGDSTLLR